MREYAKISTSTWRGQASKALQRAGAQTQLLHLYLRTCPSGNMIGLFYVPVPMICHETGLSREEVLRAFEALENVGVAFYDPEQEIVWLPEMPREEIGDRLAPTDNRVKGIKQVLISYRDCKFTAKFLERYGDAFSLSDASPFEAPSKPLPRDYEAPPKPESRKQKAETETEKSSAFLRNDLLEYVADSWKEKRGVDLFVTIAPEDWKSFDLMLADPTTTPQALRESLGRFLDSSDQKQGFGYWCKNATAFMDRRG